MGADRQREDDREEDLVGIPQESSQTRDPLVYRATLLEDTVNVTDRGHQTVAQMLSMVRAVIPVLSIAVEPIDATGFHNGPAILYRSQRLAVTPEEVRREYLLRYERVDPYHARHVVGGTDILRGTFEDPNFQRDRTNPFLEYAQEVGVPHFLRLYLRLDGQLNGYMFLGRSHHQRPFSERELTFLTLAHPVLESVYAGVSRPAPAAEREVLISDAGLTPREADVARYAATGLRAREIAEMLFLTEATVKTHLARVYRKLGVRGKAELAARLRPADA